MSLAWTPWALPGLAIFAFALALAAIVFGKGRARPANLRVALFLFLYACMMGARFGLRPLLTEPRDAYAAYALFMVILLAGPPVYLMVLSTLETPLVRPLRSRRAQMALAALTPVGPALFFARPEMFIGAPLGALHPLVGPMGFADGPWFLATLWFVYAPIFVAGAAVSLHAWRRAPAGSAARARAGWFAAAFVAHDLLFVAQWTIGPPVDDWAEVEAPALAALIDQSNLWIPLVFVTLLAYGVLRGQLFDIDLRIKRGLSRGTLLATFLVVFIGVAEIAQNWLSDEYGYLAGGLAAVALVLLIHPLQRMSERVANAAMPGVSASAEYIAYRKLQVYRATLEGALEDGAITGKERAMLDALARELAIRPEDARAIEAEVRSE